MNIEIVNVRDLHLKPEVKRQHVIFFKNKSVMHSLLHYLNQQENVYNCHVFKNFKGEYIKNYCGMYELGFRCKPSIFDNLQKDIGDIKYTGSWRGTRYYVEV